MVFMLPKWPNISPAAYSMYLDSSKNFNLTIDARAFALKANLSQGAIGRNKLIASASRTRNNTELKYAAINKEMLTTVWTIK